MHGEVILVHRDFRKQLDTEAIKAINEPTEMPIILMMKLLVTGSIII